MRIVVLTLSVIALTAPVMVSAQNNRLNPSPIAADSPAGAKKNKMICQSAVPTGSRLGSRKICRTAEEWAAINAADRQDIERIQANRYKGNQ